MTQSTKNQIKQTQVYLRAIIACLGGHFFGLNNTLLNSSQEHICFLNQWLSKYDIALYTSLIAALYPLGCILGAIYTTQFLRILQNSYRKSLLIIDLIGIIGTIQITMNSSLQNIMLGRFISGIAVGLNCAIIPLYVKIYTPQAIRGQTGTLFQSLQTFGMFIGLILKSIMPIYPKITEKDIQLYQETMNSQTYFEYYFSWRIVMGFPLICCLIRLYFMLYIFTEETPQKLVSQRKFKSLKKFCQRIYTKEELKQPHIYPQINNKDGLHQQIELTQQETQIDEKTIERSRRRRMYLGIIVQISSQINGLNGVMTFSSAVYKENTDSNSIVLLYQAMQGLSIFLFTLSSIFVIDRFGRKKVLMISALSTSISLLFVALFAYLDIFYLSFICIIVYLGCQGFGLGGVVMPYSAELVDKNDMSTCIGWRWLSYGLIVLTFQFKILIFQFYGTFIIFSVLTFLCFVYFVIHMKETKGLSTQQIHRLYY
ncbi:major facilitator superfamily protein, putative [Ichthyophthirius multifiliis]|uniref:Hexose transporter 1 n=1 Tax=Ichthyophthirius multifiliis TaxID=5932 RepID=G0QPF2_ICHMU|nr:major facilitator superfamily protein, putative [Ichthyophthirius multifiliis]EGR32920.1 major facilitator superfamily protein, putative [Ichthyophthirius multifiliis]|eukprot:XP_004036906.1 major facilitator superfamily protein, putative [Ichthyophthirius multifiliis]